MSEERNVGTDARDALVHILKRLQIGQLHHQEESLLERVGDGGCLVQQQDKAVLNHLRQRKRMKHGT
ncbi:hypothetical protein D3C81_2125050 [compost metagenome]